MYKAPGSKISQKFITSVMFVHASYMYRCIAGVCERIYIDIYIHM